MVLKTRSCNLLTVPSRSSPRAAMTTSAGRGANPYCDDNKTKSRGNGEPENAAECGLLKNL